MHRHLRATARMRYSSCVRPTHDASHTEALQRIYRTVAFRVAPPLVLLYFVAFLDRVNIGFASLTMNRDLGIGEATYGLAAGVFFVGYLLFAVPSNYALVRVGALRWISVLMICWGIVSAGMAFVHGPALYILLRFLLGAAEAGFFPGIVYYLTGWLPGSARANMLALFYFAIPLSSVVGSPVSAALMQLNGVHGMRGWQWLFLLEALPAVVLGCAVPWLLPTEIGRATWLQPQEQIALQEAIAGEQSNSGMESTGKPTWQMLLPLASAYFTLMVGLYELGFWTPRLLTSHGVSLRSLGWVNAVPYALGGAGMLLWGRLSDRRGSRRGMLVLSFLAAAAGFALTALAPSVLSVAMALSLAAFGVFSSMPVFWAAASQRMAAGAATAIGIAVINSVGNVGGFLGPYATGALLHSTHGYGAGLAGSAAALLLGSGIIWLALAPVRRVTA